MIVRKAFKYRLYPSREQQERLVVQFGHARHIYNWGLKQSQERYRGYCHLANQLPMMKTMEEACWLKEAHSQVLQQALMNLGRAFDNFFDKRAGYPKFKSKRARQSIRYPQPQEKWVAPDGGRIYLSKVGHVRLVMHRPLAGVMKNVTVSETKSGKYFISLQVEVEITEPAFTGGVVGLDLGLRDFVTLSGGEKIERPQYNRKAQRKRRRLARQLSRKKPGSRNREKARLRLARLEERIANQRRNFHHQRSRQLVEENCFIGLEDLNVREMMANRRLAKSIRDAGWSQFVEILKYKGAWYGCRVKKVSRRYPSTKTCPHCSRVVDQLPMGVRQWQCPYCGNVHDRDVNAAVNIKTEALRVLEETTAGAAGSYA
jgi:putative transposase